MAEVRQCLRSGVNRVPLKMCHRHLSKSHVSLGKHAVQAALLPVGSVFVDMLNVGLSGADGVPTGGSQDGYTRLTPPSHSCEDNHESHSCPALAEDCSPSRTRVNATQRSVSRYASGVNAWRTVSVRGGWRSSSSSLSGGQVTCVRSYSGNGAGSEPLHKTKTGYYDILEVQPAATQAQIKTAYYKQSFIYHPDRNSGSDEATVRFSEISEAYTVLGNKGLRKKYDRGLLTLSDLTTTRRPSGKEGPGRQQSRHAAVSAELRGRIYDFDSFFKSHYNEQLQRQKEIRFRKEEIQRKKDEKLHEMSVGRVSEVGIALMLLLALGLIVSLKKP